MDAFARGLLAADQIIKDGLLDSFMEDRYASYSEEMGRRIISGEESFESLEEWVLAQGEPTPKSGRQEMLESLFMRYL